LLVLPFAPAVHGHRAQRRPLYLAAELEDNKDPFRKWDMPSQSILLLATLMLCTSQLGAQVTSTAQNITVQVSSAQPWTDSGLDLQSGDVLEISAAGSSDQPTPAGATVCDPKGVTGASAQSAALPLPSAPAGALIAQFHAHGALPLLVGSSHQFHIAESSHLILGMNMSGTPLCQGGIDVKIEVIPASSGATDSQQKTRGEQLKSELSTAAQVFMSGQFGMGKPGTAASDATSSGDSSAADVPA
jgi:hypothetical protein